MNKNHLKRFIHTRSIIIFLTIASLTFGNDAQAQQKRRIEPSPWAYSWGVGMGSMIPSGDLGNRFNAGFAADTEINIYYHKAFLMINGGFSSNSIAENIDVIGQNGTTVWPANTKALHAFIGGNIGVNTSITDKISIYPFIGIGYGFIEPNLNTASSDPILENLKINSFLWNAGLGMDYNFPDKEYAPGEINRILKVGLRYQFQKPDYKDVEGFVGATNWISLRFVIGSTMPGKVVYY